MDNSDNTPDKSLSSDIMEELLSESVLLSSDFWEEAESLPDAADSADEEEILQEEADPNFQMDMSMDMPMEMPILEETISATVGPAAVQAVEKTSAAVEKTSSTKEKKQGLPKGLVKKPRVKVRGKSKETKEETPLQDFFIGFPQERIRENLMNIEKPENKRKSQNKREPENKQKPINKQKPEKKRKPINKQKPANKQLFTDKQKSIRKGKNTNKVKPVSKEAYNFSKHFKLDFSFQEKATEVPDTPETKKTKTCARFPMEMDDIDKHGKTTDFHRNKEEDPWRRRYSRESLMK